jgi:N-acetylmuramoyl-L-alanine amidase
MLESGGKMIAIIKKSTKLSFVALVFLICLFVNVSEAEKKHLIIIDPAHGGQDTGVKLTDKTSEEEITLAIALAMQKELAAENNIEVVLTRNSDTNVTIEDRKAIVSKNKPELFLSLHINAGFGKEAEGFELYYPGFSKHDENKKAAKNSPKSKKNKYLNDSVRLANFIQKNMDTLFPRKSRGLREADVPVIDGLTITALVVEIGFATNAEEKKKLLSANTQVEIAKALAKSIILFYR